MGGGRMEFDVADAALAAEGLVDTLLRLIEGEEVSSWQVPPRLIVRRSCGAV